MVRGEYQFGPFHLDVRERRLSRGGDVIPLRLKVFETLLALVENAGRLVTKQELLDTVWPGTAVEENNLNHNVSVLRKALGERATIESPAGLLNRRRRPRRPKAASGARAQRSRSAGRSP